MNEMIPVCKHAIISIILLRVPYDDCVSYNFAYNFDMYKLSEPFDSQALESFDEIRVLASSESERVLALTREYSLRASDR